MQQADSICIKFKKTCEMYYTLCLCGVCLLGVCPTDYTIHTALSVFY